MELMDVLMFFAGMKEDVAWDAIKVLFHKITSKKTSDAIETLTSVMKEFYEDTNREFDESVVMTEYIKQARKWVKKPWRYRDIIENTMGEQLTDEEFKKWYSLLKAKIPSFYTFTDRNCVYERIHLKISEDNKQESYGDFENIFDNIIYRFNGCWKQGIIDILKRYNIDVSYAEKNENNDNILKYFKEIINDIDLDLLNSEDRRELVKLINKPHFNVVQLISGVSGSGKTHFVNNYRYRTSEYIHSNICTAFPCIVYWKGVSSLREDIIESLKGFIELESDSMDEYSEVLDSLSLKVCFVIENVSSQLKNGDDWNRVVEIIKEFSKYDQFRFMITINEYDYYLVESDRDFLECYCISNDENSLFNYSLSIDEINNNQDIISEILVYKFDVANEFENMLTTPIEALYYGECTKDEENNAPPAGYYEYIKRIVEWKQSQMLEVDYKEIIHEVTEQKKSIIKTSMDVSPYCKVQLLTREQEYGVFDTSPSYHLRVYPFWAAKIIGEDKKNILEYSEDLREWLVSCYIFSCSMNNTDNNDWSHFFDDLQKCNLLDYAVFCANKADNKYINELKEYLLSVEVKTPRLCYAILRFVDYHQFKIKYKFKLMAHIADAVISYNLIRLYRRIMERIIDTFASDSKIRKNMTILASCTQKEINRINGYLIGQQYMELIGDQEIKKLVWIIKEIVKQRNLEDIVSSKTNDSFMDYFIRKCFEYYILNHKEDVIQIYNEIRSAGLFESNIGAYIKRNLTCAAGNVFETSSDDAYKNKYILLAKSFLKEPKLYDRLTAWFLVSNSVGDYNNVIDPALLDILDEIKKDKKIMERCDEQIKLFEDKYLRKE